MARRTSLSRLWSPRRRSTERMSCARSSAPMDGMAYPWIARSRDDLARSLPAMPPPSMSGMEQRLAAASAASLRRLDELGPVACLHASDEREAAVAVGLEDRHLALADV